MSTQIRRYVSFKLGDEEYGIGAGSVLDLIGTSGVTRSRVAPSYVYGSIRWQGGTLPVLNLRAKLGLPSTLGVERGVVIVVELAALSANAQTMRVGLLVDELPDVCVLRDATIAPFQPLSGPTKAPLVRGIGMLEQRLIFLLDIAQVLDACERAACLDAVANDALAGPQPAARGDLE